MAGGTPTFFVFVLNLLTLWIFGNQLSGQFDVQSLVAVKLPFHFELPLFLLFVQEDFAGVRPILLRLPPWIVELRGISGG